MKVALSGDFNDRGVKVTLGVIEAEVTVQPSSPELLGLLETACSERIADFDGQPASSNPHIAATRKAYKAFGKDPARYRPAAEALTRRVLQGKGLYHVNNVVDINNLISVKSGISIGTYLSDRIDGDVIFRRANEGETYRGIGRADLNLEGLPVFSDNIGPFGSPTSDSERTMITEGLHPITMILIQFGEGGHLDEWIKEARELLLRFCQANLTE